MSDNDDEALDASSSLVDIVLDVKVVDEKELSSDGTINDAKRSLSDEYNACDDDDDDDDFQVTEGDLDGIVDIVPPALDEPPACHEEDGDDRMNVQILDTASPDASSMEIESILPSDSLASTESLTAAAVVTGVSTSNDAKGDDVNDEVADLVKLATTLPSRGIDETSETICNEVIDGDKSETICDMVIDGKKSETVCDEVIDGKDGTVGNEVIHEQSETKGNDIDDKSETICDESIKGKKSETICDEDIDETNETTCDEDNNETSGTICDEAIDGTSETLCDDAQEEPITTIVPIAKIASITSNPNDTNNKIDNNDRFYALRKGKSTGNCIYLQHSHMAEQLEDFPDAVHAVFNDWKDAVAFIQNDPDRGAITFSDIPGPSISSSAQPDKRTVDNHGSKGLSLDGSGSSISSSAQPEKRKFTSDDAVDNQARKEARHEGTIRNEEITSLRKGESITPTQPQPEWQSEVYVSVYNTESWDLMYQSLKTFHAEAGNTDVPAGSRLGAWVAQQRKDYQNFITGKESDMTQQRVDKLQSINFFFMSTKKALKFEQRVDELIKFKEDSGNLDPPSNTLLYKWVYSIRRKYRDMKEDKHVSGLDQQKIQRLDEIGFSWNSVKENRKQRKIEVLVQETKPKAKPTISKKELRWNELFEQLKTYKEENGNFTVTRHGSTLGRWVSSQRLAYRKFKNGEMYSPIFNKEKIDKLIDIGFDFECKRGRKSGVEDASTWDVMYEEMQKFKDEHGHCIPPTQPSTLLRRWVEKQRSEYKKIRAGEDSHLTLMRIQRLNDIDFSFEAKCKPKTWEERYDELVEFKDKFGHCKVPRLYNGLGKWVADQRQKYSKLMQGKKTNMTQEKAQKLTDLGMIWVVFKLPPKEERAERKPWAERFQELLAFQNEHGHTVVPQHFPVLGHWVHTQRVHYKLMKQGRKSLMTPEQAFQLADIGFTFEVMPRKKSTIRQSLGNPYPHLPLIASAGVTEVARTFPEHQLTDANLDHLKDESAPYQNTAESILYHTKDDGGPYQSRGDGEQYHSKDDGTAYGIGNTFDEYGI